MKRLFTLLSSLLLFSFTILQAQTVRYVKEGGSGDGSSWGTASGNLQAMIDAAHAAGGGEVWVAAGTYKPGTSRDASFQMKNNVKIYGGFVGGETTLADRPAINPVANQSSGSTISGDIGIVGTSNDNSYHLFYHPDGTNLNSTAVLDGFVLTGGYGDGDWRSNNSRGGAIFNEGSSPTIKNCSFLKNFSPNGGAIFQIGGNPAVINCSFQENAASSDGGGICFNQTNGTVINCTFLKNSASFGGAVYNISNRSLNGSYVTIINSSFQDNFLNPGYSYGSAIGSYNEESTCETTVINSVFWNNGGNNTFDNATGTFGPWPTVNVRNSLLESSVIRYTDGGNNLISTTSPFVSATSFALNAGSMAIDAGNDADYTAANGPITDVAGLPRIKGCSIDMGAVEYGASLSPTRLYVKAGATGANNGSSWSDAFTSLQDALSQAKNCKAVKEIWVAEGTYKPTTGSDQSTSFSMKNDVAILGGFPGTGNPTLVERNWQTYPTIISGDINNDNDVSGPWGNSIHLFFNEGVNSTAVLDGFVLTGGWAQGSGDSWLQPQYGGAIYNKGSSPTIRNCSFQKNGALSLGGAIYNTDNSHPALTNCLFLNNFSLNGYGGAIFNNGSSPVISNCVFRNNSAAGFSNGGAICNASNSNVTVTNCTFQNDGSGGGVIANDNSSQVTATNSIIWGNSSSITGDGATIVTYSIVQGGYSGTGNLNVDPQFVDAANGDLRLHACSPAINAGSDAANTTDKDLDGNARKVGTIDMGAYEFQGTIPSAPTITTQPQPTQTVCQNNSATTLSIGASGTGLTYQWFSNGSNNNSGGTAIGSATTETYTPPTTTAGTRYYYVEVSNTCGTKVTSDVATVTVNALPTWYKDADNDSYSDGTTLAQCIQPGGYKLASALIATSGDCNDADINEKPGQTWYIDNDGDGYAGSTQIVCKRPAKGKLSSELSGSTTDCNDNDAAINPAAVEVCGNGIDDNCNGQVDERGCTPCANATGLTTTNITSTGATLNWNAAANPTQWQVKYKSTSPGSKWMDVFSNHWSRSVTLSGLTPNQRYMWHIRAKCGKTWTNYSGDIIFTTAAAGPATTKSVVKVSDQVQVLEIETWRVQVLPNPSTTQFTLRFQSSRNEQFTLRVLDNLGRLVETKTGMAAGSTITIGQHYRTGIYFVEAVQGKEKQVLKLIKQ